MTAKNKMRTLTYLFEIESDGKSVAKITRAVKDVDDAMQRVNKATADNVTVTKKEVSGKKEALAATRKAITESNKLAKSTDKVVEYYTRLNQELKREDVNMEVVNAQMRAGVTSSSAHGKQIEKLVLEYQQLRNHGDKAGTSMRNFRGIMQNAGWQMQDTIVQLQMGTSAFTVLSQQGSQFAAAFGAGGAVVGAFIALAGVIGGTLFKSLVGVNDELDDFTDKMKGVRGRIDEIKLRELSSDITLQKDALKELNKAFDDLDFDKLKELTGVEDGFFLDAARSDVIAAARREISDSKLTLVQLEKDKADLIKSMNEKKEGDSKKQKDAAADLVKEWTDLTNTYNLSEVSLAKYNVRQALTESKQLDQINTVNALIDGYYELKHAREDDVIAAEDAAAREAAIGKIEAGVDAAGKDPYAAEIARYKANRDELLYLQYEYDEADTAARARVNDAKEAEERRHAEAMKQIDSAVLQSQMMNYSTFLGGMAGLMGQLSSLAEEGSSEAEALFYATQAIAFATTLVNTQMAYVKALADPSNPTVLGSIPVAEMIRGLGYASAGIIAGTTIAGAFDKGGVIPQDQYGIVSEYGDELVDGVLVKGKQGGTRVTSREDTAKIMNQGGDAGKAGVTIVQNITVTGNGDAALSQAMRKAAKQGAKEGYSMVAQDFKTGRGIRQTLKRSARV